jgi:hypothetical protein
MMREANKVADPDLLPVASLLVGGLKETFRQAKTSKLSGPVPLATEYVWEGAVRTKFL